MLQNSAPLIEHLPEEDTPKILFHVSRYWPAVSGAALHTREMIHHLSEYQYMCVVRHSADEPTNKEIAFSRNPTLKLTDGRTPIYQIGPHPALSWSMQKLAEHYAKNRWIRPLFHQLVKLSVKAPIAHIARSYDVIHAVYTGMTSSVRAAQLVAKRQKKPFVLTPLPHIESPQKKAPASLRTLYQNSDAIISMTEFEKEWLIRQGVRRNRIHVCPVGPLVSGNARPDGFRQKYKLGEDPIVLFISRQIPGKGYQPLSYSASQVWKRYPKMRFVFIGPKTEESMAFFKEFRDPRILNLGEVSLEDKSSALAACDVLCIPSIQESLGVTYLEAWLYEKPVIAADIPVMHSVIDQEKDGLIVPPNPKAIASSIIRLMDHPQWRHELGCRGYRKVRAQYEWNLLASQLSSIYQTLTNAYSHS